MYNLLIKEKLDVRGIIYYLLDMSKNSYTLNIYKYYRSSGL